MMSDYLIRVLSDKANVIGLACRTTDLVNLACRLHGTTPTASAALGRALTGGLLLGALAKPGLRVGLKFEGNGPMKKILVEADSEGAVRGFVGVPDIGVMVKEDGKLHVSGALGTEGFLTVFKDVGLDEPYQGIVKLRTGEIAEDIAYYFVESEQIPSAVGLGVFVETDGRVLGPLVDILRTGSNDVYVVRTERGFELLLPAIKDVVREVDLASVKMYVTLLPGLPERVSGPP